MTSGKNDELSDGEKCAGIALVLLIITVIVSGIGAFKADKPSAYVYPARCTADRDETEIDESSERVTKSQSEARYTVEYALHVTAQAGEGDEVWTDVTKGNATVRVLVDYVEWDGVAFGRTKSSYSAAADEMAEYYTEEDRRGYLKCWYRKLRVVDVSLRDPDAPPPSRASYLIVFGISATVLGLLVLWALWCIADAVW